MHIAIDDIYGPHSRTASKFVSGERRTHVAVIFPDSDVERIRDAISELLKGVNSLGVAVDEFHFADIYNRRKGWEAAPSEKNLDIFCAFAEIYAVKKWPVIVQTIDDRSFSDNGLEMPNFETDFIDLSKRDHVSFLMLMKVGLPEHLPEVTEDVHLYVDEGIGKPGQKIATELLPIFAGQISGSYQSSAQEPLLQIADFLAYSINRCTHLGMKEKRSEFDMWFLDLIGDMGINSPQLKYVKLPRKFDVTDFDELHRSDRDSKGIT